MSIATNHDNLDPRKLVWGEGRLEGQESELSR